MCHINTYLESSIIEFINSIQNVDLCIKLRYMFIFLQLNLFSEFIIELDKFF